MYNLFPVFIINSTYTMYMSYLFITLTIIVEKKTWDI